MRFGYSGIRAGLSPQSSTEKYRPETTWALDGEVEIILVLAPNANLDPHPSTEGDKQSLGARACLETDLKHSRTGGFMPLQHILKMVTRCKTEIEKAIYLRLCGVPIDWHSGTCALLHFPPPLPCP